MVVGLLAAVEPLTPVALERQRLVVLVELEPTVEVPVAPEWVPPLPSALVVEEVAELECRP